MVTVFLALGSNVGNSTEYIAQATRLLKQKVADSMPAPLYTSSPVGYTDQPDFLNTAFRGETDLSPMELLKFVKEVEAEVGRIVRFRWGPREIDIDIIFYGDIILDADVLTIPHPRFAERDFVLRPLCDIDPGFLDPRSKQSVSQLFAKLPASELAILKKQSND